MCPHSKLLLLNKRSGQVKYIGISYFDFMENYTLNMAISYFGDYSGYEPVPVDCGKCAYCKKKRINKWKFKLTCESKTCQNITHLTLTFSDEWLNDDYSLVQKCFKRVRKMIPDKKFKYFLVSEHGTQATCRLHYHILIFGLSLKEVQYFFKRQWYYGFIKVKPFNQGQIGYIVNYIFKQDEIKRQSQRLGYDYWQQFISQGIIRLAGYSYNFPYYFRKKFNSVHKFMNELQLLKLRRKIDERLLKVKRKGCEVLARFLRSEAEQSLLEASKWFERIGYKV